MGPSEYDDLQGHPALGTSWEGFVVENILGHLSDKWRASYYKTAEQTEIDLVLEKSTQKVWAIEIKRTAAPRVKPGFHRAREEVQLTRKYVVYSGKERLSARLLQVSLIKESLQLTSPL